eukprot:TRINITY_DN6005_c0_g1_i1.p1 TRINITY_DN6005_c0_g1~~TRINITY_DN6005_c0_g1_i1.p1  ORF type:complete len:107 (-),score=29.73 TRINITY_DN6005_c0_g1_i1:27-347(-)
MCPYASGSRSAPAVTHIFHHHDHQHRIEFDTKESPGGHQPTSSTAASGDPSSGTGSDLEDEDDLSRPTPIAAHEIEQLSEDEALALALQLSQAESLRVGMNSWPLV